MKAKITFVMSRKSLKEAIETLQKFRNGYESGLKEAIKVATEELYKKIIQNCNEVGITHHTDAIHWEFDKSTNTGRVWVDGAEERGKVIIFNEMGTGIVGSQNPHPVFSWEYDVNQHGEKGWWYPTTDSDPNPIKKVDKNGQLRGWTKGLPSRRMFFDAFVEIVYALGDFVDVELKKKIGKLY